MIFIIDLASIICVVVGLFVGAAIAAFHDRHKDHSGPMLMVMYVSECIFGALGSLSANQFITYGPVFLGINIIPAFVGALVLGFVALWFGKHFHFLRNIL